MNPQKIKGNYIISFDLGEVVTDNSFVFTNSDRNTHLNYGSGLTGLWYLKDIEDRYSYRSVHFITQNAVNVKRARIRTAGAEGLRPALSSVYAAIIQFRLFRDLGLSDPLPDNCQIINFTKYNEWEKVDLSWTTPNAVDENTQEYYLGFRAVDLGLDDFNLQTAYVGETFNPFIDLEIDTAGMLIDYSGEVV